MGDLYDPFADALRKKAREELQAQIAAKNGLMPQAPQVQGAPEMAYADPETLRPAVSMAEPAPPPVDEGANADKQAVEEVFAARMGRAGEILARAGLRNRRPDTAYFDQMAQTAEGRRQLVHKSLQEKLAKQGEQDFDLKKLGLQRGYKLEDERPQRDFDAAPVTSTYEQLATQFGVKLPPGTTNSQAKQVLEMAEKAYAARMRAQELQLTREALRGKQKDEKDSKDKEKNDKDVKELAEDLGKLGAPEFFEKYNDTKSIIDDNPDDLPGVGPVAGHLPNWMVSEEGKALRQSSGQMLSAYRKGQTGSGMSDQERAEYGEITGLLKSGNEDAFRQGVERLKRAVAAQVANRAAGTPKAAEDLAKRQPYLRQALDTAAQPRPSMKAAPSASSVPKVTSKAEWEALPSGAEYIDPSGARRRKK